MKLNILIGGEAGQGLNTIDLILGKTIFKSGYHLFSSKDYMSRIRGGHNFNMIRFSNEPVTAISHEVDILVALNEETVTLHKDQLKEQAIVIFDGDVDTGGKELISLPARTIAKEINPRGVNTVFVGAVLKILGLSIEKARTVLKDYFKKEEVADDNIKLLEKGYQKVNSYFNLPAASGLKDQLYLDGNNAIGLGAAIAGVQFYAAYPMSPSTSIMNYLAGKQSQLGIVVEQAEDEIAALNMALGGSYAGIRSMTGTSGGGFALMTEAVGLAGIAEIPVVIADIQRPGPATGLPTRTEQGDLLFAINAGQGDVPLMVVAPRDHKDAFEQTFRSFNLADKYQIPVIILSDQFLADSARNLESFQLERLKIERGLPSPEELAKIKDYKRYEITETGISPRIYPGQVPGEVVLIDSDEHDQYGHIIEGAAMRKAMVEKRGRKIAKLAAEELLEPVYQGGETIDFLLIGWGSSYGPLQEAVQLLNQAGYHTGLLSFNDVWPLPTGELTTRVEKGARVIVVENNATAQFSRLIRSETGLTAEKSILKYDGRPYSGKEIFQRVISEVIK